MTINDDRRLAGTRKDDPMMTRTALALAALATLALAPAAGAATQGAIPVGRDGVTGTFQTAGEQQTWTVQLKAGLNYVLGVDSSDALIQPAEIAAAGGAILCTGW